MWSLTIHHSLLIMKTPAIAIFDIGKTNKKLFLFDEDYNIVFERSVNFDEITDEDGDACENVEFLHSWLLLSFEEALAQKEFDIKAVNFSAYGASFVYVDELGNTIAPLYNYLKQYPEKLKKQFYNTYGGEEEFSKRTASPVLGALNSGMQVYRLKYEKPLLFDKIKYALHLPQFLSFLFSKSASSEITSIGCHTNLWDFTKNNYHEWVSREGILQKLAPLRNGDEVVAAAFPNATYRVGIGLHDSSAALIPYLVSFREPFILISTGTWCISLNPFNQLPLTKHELNNDCLCYMTYRGNPVKASRLFAGNEHEKETRRIAQHFGLSNGWYKQVNFDASLINGKRFNDIDLNVSELISVPEFSFAKRNLDEFDTAAQAYHELVTDIIKCQFYSTALVLKGTDVRRIFVDGGFSKNPVYMNLLAAIFPQQEIYAASMAQATAVGAALSIHDKWNSKPLPGNIISLKNFSTGNLISRTPGL